jgi:hypothetical protein
MANLTGGRSVTGNYPPSTNKHEWPYNLHFLPPDFDVGSPKGEKGRNNSHTSRINQPAIMVQKVDVDAQSPDESFGEYAETLEVEGAGATEGVVEGSGEEEFVGAYAGGFKGGGCHGSEFRGDGEDAFKGGVVIGFYDGGRDLGEDPNAN